MSEEAINKSILKAAFDQWHESKGTSTDVWLELVDENVVFRSAAEGQSGLAFTTLRRSKADLIGYLSGLTEMFEMNHYTVDRYVAEGDCVIAIGSTSWRNRETGKDFVIPKADMVRFRDGKIIEFYEIYDSAPIIATLPQPAP